MVRFVQDLFGYIVFLSLLLLPQVVLSKRKLAVLNEDTWSEMLTGEWMVEFYAPWCPVCKKLQPTWIELAELSDYQSIKVGNVDITVNPGLVGRFIITDLPTIFHVKDGVFRQYRESMDKESFFSFVEEKKWQNIYPVPGWRSPQSYTMTTMSLFFKLTMLLRIMHNTMVEEYGIPYWGSYIMFGILTMLASVLLLLLVVIVIDSFSLSKMGCQQLPKRSNTPHEKEASSSGISNYNLQPTMTTYENNDYSLHVQTTVQLLQRGRVRRIYNLNHEPSSPPPPPDRQDIFERHVASKLRRMDKSQQMLSERLVSEVLFRGQMGLLSRKTCLSDDEMSPNVIKIEEGQ